MSKESGYERFLKTYSGRKLLEEHSLEEEGTWAVHGEDPKVKEEVGTHAVRAATISCVGAREPQMSEVEG